MTDRPRVVIADDQALVRTGFRMILAAAGIEVVAEAADGQQAVEAVRRTRPDLVLMDIRMPVLDGLEATRRILATPGPAAGAAPGAVHGALSGAAPAIPRGTVPAPEPGPGTGPGGAPRIVILTTFDLDQYVYAALAAGASGFLLKDVTPEYLVAAVRLVRAGDALLAPAITRRLVERFASGTPRTAALHRDLATLTPRELDVLRLLARGLSNSQVAAHFRLSEATVKTHVTRILSKLGLRDRAQAVVVAYETGLITPGGRDGAHPSP
jgi:DNA-binding NarL/FixJ family response regulator